VSLTLSQRSHNFAVGGEEISIDVTSNYGWKTYLSQPSAGLWLSLYPGYSSAGKTTVTISVGANTSSMNRRMRIVFRAQDREESFYVSQSAAPISADNYYADRQVVQLQRATTGRGVELVFMGEGYIRDDMASDGTGLYERDVRTSMEAIFSIYPYSIYREYFNVWMVAAVSNQRGMSSTSPQVHVDTKFQTVWEGGNSTIIKSNSDIVRSYANLVAQQVGKPLNEITAIMPVNANAWAGTCEMYYDGFSISMCPKGGGLNFVTIHEAGGHGFGKLGDEYVYNESMLPDDLRQSLITEKTELGWMANLDVYADINQTSWRGFAGRPGYEMVGTYPGAYMYRQGIWRPEDKSCMAAENIAYFNAPSRFSIVSNMYRLAGLPTYTFEQFLIDDASRPPIPASRSEDGVTAPFRHFAPPIIHREPSDDFTENFN
jgi:hypothetical protein